MRTERAGDRYVFECRVDDAGMIAVPASWRKALAGKRLSVRLVPRHEAAALTAAGVTEDEIDLIGSIQSEPRDQVIAFLLSEGSLRRKSRSRSGRL